MKCSSCTSGQQRKVSNIAIWIKRVYIGIRCDSDFNNWSKTFQLSLLLYYICLYLFFLSFWIVDTHWRHQNIWAIYMEFCIIVIKLLNNSEYFILFYMKSGYFEDWNTNCVSVISHFFFVYCISPYVVYNVNSHNNERNTIKWECVSKLLTVSCNMQSCCMKIWKQIE